MRGVGVLCLFAFWGASFSSLLVVFVVNWKGNELGLHAFVDLKREKYTKRAYVSWNLMPKFTFERTYSRENNLWKYLYKPGKSRPSEQYRSFKIWFSFFSIRKSNYFLLFHPARAWGVMPCGFRGKRMGVSGVQTSLLPLHSYCEYADDPSHRQSVSLTSLSIFANMFYSWLNLCILYRYHCFSYRHFLSRVCLRHFHEFIINLNLFSNFLGRQKQFCLIL